MIEAWMLHDYYRKLFGAPSRSAQFEAAERNVEVLKWDPDDRGSDVFLYATIGLSVHGAVAQDVSHRAELFVGMLPRADEIATGLAGATFELIHRRAAPQHGLTVTFSEALWQGSSFNGFVVTVPRAEVIPSARLGDAHVQFYQLIPITARESEAIRRDGYEVFRATWEAKSIPFWDPRRHSSV